MFASLDFCRLISLAFILSSRYQGWPAARSGLPATISLLPR